MKLASLFLLLSVLIPSLGYAEWCPPIPGAPCFGPPNNPPPPNYPPGPPGPPPGYGFCQGADFFGRYSDGRDARLALRGNGFRLDGTLFLQRPNDRWPLRADCREYNGYAEVDITFSNGTRHRAEIFMANDRRVYLDGEDAYGRRFTFQRR